MAPTFPPQAHLGSADQKSKVQTSQPAARESMTLSAPTETASTQAIQRDQEEEMRLRGGGEACPGRFCFIIPCPLPCNFCII